MSAESPRRSRAGGPLVVPPQPPGDRSIMDTVSGFINDVASAGGPGADPKDVVQWARFESARVPGPDPEADSEGDLSPLLLVVGYGSGVQVWSIRPGGEAQEALSWRQGQVRLLRLLPAPSRDDAFQSKRPLVALCDSAGPGVPFCSLSFISLTGGDQVKSIKFKNPILDVAANKRSIIVSFAERLAVFDARTLEDRLTVTTCYPCPCPLGGPSPANPIALGDRWLAYAERKLSPTKRSSGGCEGEGVASYTATVLHAAKSLGKGLRGLGESVASSLGGTRPGGLSQSPSPPHSEQLQPGVVTIIDVENWKINDEENSDTMDDCPVSAVNNSVIAHFVAHSESIVALKFDASGMILVTADKRGHDFHVFRIHPHPSGPTLASVHHLYILHRGDTTAKVQDISLSLDCRWAAISTLRGTTHVFPITPYGGAVGVRTHASPHVVNRLSRFHRSAGLAADGRSNSPVGENLMNQSWYPNPRLPPFPAPCTLSPLSQLRPSAAPTIPTHTITRNSSGRQRLSSLSEEGQAPLAVCACWGVAARSPNSARFPSSSLSHSAASPPVAQALYVMSAHGHLIQYHIHPKHVTGIPKEKVCDDTSIEVEVEAKVKWPLFRPPSSNDITPPLPSNNVLIKPLISIKSACDKGLLDAEDRWLSQVEIMTHAGPHRRLWMGPQFVFKTYNATAGTSLSLLDCDAVEVGTGPSVARSNPVNMPPGARPIVPVLIESGSASSLEHSPRLSDAYSKAKTNPRECQTGSREAVNELGHREGEVRLKEDLAEAMRDADQGAEPAPVGRSGESEDAGGLRRIVNPVGNVTSGIASPALTSPSADDSHALSNEDEALFRPVVRAPRSLPARDAPPARPLSTRTLLPAERLPAFPTPRPPPSDSAPLDDRVVIPARLSVDSRGDVSVDLPITFEAPIVSKVRAESEPRLVEAILDPVIADQVPIPEVIHVEIKKKITNKKTKERKRDISKIKESPAIPLQLECELEVSECIGDAPHSYLDEISMAVENIEFCREGSAPIEFGRGPDVNPMFAVSAECDAELPKENSYFSDCEKVYSCGFPEIESAAEDVSETFVMNLTAPPAPADEAAWELLTEVRPLPVAIPSPDFGDAEILTREELSLSTPKDISLADDSRSAGKKNKRGKLRPGYVFAPDFSGKAPSEPRAGPPDDAPKMSWSAVASGDTKVKRSHLVEAIEDDESFASKISVRYNESNLVVAVCDTPGVDADLCFVEEHHSRFPEPPPLGPLDSDPDERRHEETVASQRCHLDDDDEDFTIRFDHDRYESEIVMSRSYAEDHETEEPAEDDEGCAAPQSPPLSDSKLVNISNKEKRDSRKSIDRSVPPMEKSSDEENVSPSSESDDYGGAARRLGAPEEARMTRSAADADTPIVSSNPAQASKTNKKKPKRKRR